ncbi:MAG: YicC family protein [Acetobacteraceae bacterium]|nr:YicC family protein [Acetobacteraceae bacterium]
MAAPLSSMTGFARCSGTLPDGAAYVWELRSVNGRGLDLRLRLPPGLDALETPLKEAASRAMKRGNIQAALTLRTETRPVSAPDPAVIERYLALAQELAARIPGAPPPRAETLLSLPGVFRAEAAEPDEAQTQARVTALAKAFDEAIVALVAARRGEGEKLRAILGTLLDEIAALRDDAAREAAGQPAAQRARFEESLAQLLHPEARARIPEERLAQEVALLAAKSDVREELDRLSAHLDAARALLAEGEGAGRKLDFLTQEFVREANTLCSKSASVALTRTGLALKAAIERLKEQAANVE